MCLDVCERFRMLTALRMAKGQPQIQGEFDTSLSFPPTHHRDKRPQPGSTRVKSHQILCQSVSLNTNESGRFNPGFGVLVHPKFLLLSLQMFPRILDWENLWVKSWNIMNPGIQYIPVTWFFHMFWRSKTDHLDVQVVTQLA